MTPEEVQALAAVATFFAAALAVWATFKAPKRAAEFAEGLRLANMEADERRRMKLTIFSNLMQYRAQILNPNAIGSLNLIDLIFRDVPEVRLAWAHFLAAANEKPFSSAKLMERYYGIIEKMARHLNLADEITISDIENTYYPQILGDIDEASLLENQEKLSRFKGQAAQQ